jgi:hypothetical protein
VRDEVDARASTNVWQQQQRQQKQQPRPLRLPFPIKAFSPSGYIDTTYLDGELRLSKGDKGSIFVARRADAAAEQQQQGQQGQQ